MFCMHGSSGFYGDALTGLQTVLCNVLNEYSTSVQWQAQVVSVTLAARLATGAYEDTMSGA